MDRLPRGEFVQTWFDGGRDGSGFTFGVIEASGPTAFVVRWESGNRHRRKHGHPDIHRITDPELRLEAARTLKRTT